MTGGSLAASPFRLLGDDELRLVLLAVGEDGAFFAALAHRSFCAVLRSCATTRRRQRRTVLFLTPVSAATASVQLFRWATADGCGWNLALSGAHAAQRGALDVLRHLVLRAHARVDAWTAASAALNGHTDVLDWLVAASCPLSPLVCEAAAGGGHLGTLQWLRAKGCPWDASVGVAAARGGHLHVLRWAREAGCPRPSKHACSAAAIGGHLAVLQWLREYGVRWEPLTATWAAAGGHLELLRWACAHGCKLQHSACEAAARRGDLACLAWLRARAAPWRADAAFAAAAFGHLHVLEWLVEQPRWPGPQQRPLPPRGWLRVAVLAHARGHRPVAEWAAARARADVQAAITAGHAEGVTLRALELQAGVAEGQCGDGLGRFAAEYSAAFSRRRAIG